jgi:cytidylate kinase
MHVLLDKDPYDQKSLIESARKTIIQIIDGRIHANGQDIDEYLHTDAVDAHVARISAIIPIRKIVNEQLRESAGNLDVVAEGRDVTTVVFPHADYKFYFDANVSVRAKRRFEQQDTELSLEEIERAIAARDEIDKTKEFGALRAADDALYIDTSYLTIDEVCEKVVHAIKTQ